MPIRAVETSIATLSGPVGSNNAILSGLRWTVQPLMPIPDDGTTQATAFIALNKDKTANVSVWRAKYAEDPTGALRFKPAVPYTYPAGTHAASAPANPPHQRYSEELDSNGRPEFGNSSVGAYDWPGRGMIETEAVGHCTVFAPEGGTGRPGVFHIHGGGWGVYHAEGPQQLGHRLAAHKGLGVCCVEYPLSTFGHFPHPDLIQDDEPSTAYTFIKQGLKWFYENASAFGVDRTKIAISGTSAGGAAVQLLMEDDEAQSWFQAGFIGSGGGSGNYPTASYYYDRVRKFESAIRTAKTALYSSDPTHETFGDAIAALGFAGAMQNALPVRYVQALADARTTVTAASVAAAKAGGSLVTTTVATDNVYPFKRGNYDNAMEAAKGGKFRKPFVVLFAECEALNLLGSDYDTIKATLLALPTATLDGWAQRLGYANYAAWQGAAWITAAGVTDLEDLSSAQFKTSIDAAAIDCENRRVLYTHAVFSYPAWRIARAAADTASATSYLAVNNFSANSVWAGHSQEVALMFGALEWLVAGGGSYPSADVPGEYVNNRMDAFYVSEMMMDMIANLADSGDPNGTYSYTGFNLFSDAATHPADSGQYQGTWTAYTIANEGYANVIGKYFDPVDNLNAGTFDPDITGGLDSHRDARLRHVQYMETAMLEYLGLLEP